MVLFTPVSIASYEFVFYSLNLPKTLQPGDVVLIDKPNNIKNLLLNGKKFSQTAKENKWLAVVNLDDKKSLEVSGEIVTKANKTRQFFYKTIQVSRASRPPARLRIPASVWKKMDDRFESEKAKQRELMWSLLKNISGNLSPECWALPLNSKVVSKFASPRHLPNGRHYYHGGEDLRAATGTPIMAPASGRVVFSGPMIVPGNVVVLSHGDGVYSRFMHLSEFKVKQGDEVTKGQIIALSGATGRVEAPHLHWEVVWKESLANPRMFVQQWNKVCDSEYKSSLTASHPLTKSL